MTTERQVGEERVVRFELEYADGRIRRLLGEDAEQWKNWLDGAAGLAGNHGMTPGPVSWIDIPALGEPRGRTAHRVVDGPPPAGPIETAFMRGLYNEYLGVDPGKSPPRTVIAGAVVNDGAVEKLELYNEDEDEDS